MRGKVLFGWVPIALLLLSGSMGTIAEGAPDRHLAASATPQAPDIRFEYILADRFEQG